MSERKSSVILELQNRIGGPLRQMQRQVRHATREVGRDFSRLNRVTRRYAVGIAGAATGIGYAASRAVSNVADTGDELAKTSRDIGVNIKTLQRWQYVANRQGVSQDKLNQGLKTFSRRWGQLRTQHGKGTLGTYLKDANPQLLKALEHTKKLKTAFNLYLKAMAATPNHADRIAGAAAAFSRGNLEISQIVDGGYGVVQQLEAQYKRLFGAMSADTAHAAERFKDALTNLGTALQGAKFTIVGKQLDALTASIKKLTNYIVGHHAEIARWSAQFANKLPKRIQKTMKSIQDTAQSIQNLVHMIGGWKNAAMGIMGLLAGPWLVALATAGGAVLKYGWKLGKVIAKQKELRSGMETRGAGKLGLLGGAGTSLITLGALGGWDSYNQIKKNGLDKWMAKRSALSPGSWLAYRYAEQALGGIKSWFGAGGGREARRSKPSAPDNRPAPPRPAPDSSAMPRPWLPHKQAAPDNQPPPLRRRSTDQPSAAKPAAPQQPVNGLIRIQIDHEGRPQLRSLWSEGPVDLDVDSGPLLPGH
ncbi:hypothetical protein ACS8YF_00360 [Salinisphaera sp. SWV1]|uniref:hypothetical protein n=1 Tax=Salinisphaera sp. SWV1 TaxID=3454139 RepID=UPI003F825B89